MKKVSFEQNIPLVIRNNQKLKTDLGKILESSQNIANSSKYSRNCLIGKSKTSEKINLFKKLSMSSIPNKSNLIIPNNLNNVKRRSLTLSPKVKTHEKYQNLNKISERNIEQKQIIFPIKNHVIHSEKDIENLMKRDCELNLRLSKQINKTNMQKQKFNSSCNSISNLNKSKKENENAKPYKYQQKRNDNISNLEFKNKNHILFDEIQRELINKIHFPKTCTKNSLTIQSINNLKIIKNIFSNGTDKEIVNKVTNFELFKKKNKENYNYAFDDNYSSIYSSQIGEESRVRINPPKHESQTIMKIFPEQDYYEKKYKVENKINTNIKEIRNIESNKGKFTARALTPCCILI